MDKLSDISAWREVVVQAFTEVGAKLGAFVPNLVGALLILLIGWAVSRSIEVAARRAMRTLGIDRAATRLRFAEVLQQAGVGMSLSEVVAKLLFWLLMLTFVLSSVETLGLKAVTATIDRLIAYIPNLIGAALIALLGLLLARFLASLVASGAAAAGFANASHLGFLTQASVAGLVLVIAVEQLGVATDVLVAPLTALIAAGGLAAGLAFALGARPIVTHILAGHFLKQSLPRDAFVEVEGQRGVVERIGATDTLLRNGEQRWSVPNGRLLEHVILR